MQMIIAAWEIEAMDILFPYKWWSYGCLRVIAFVTCEFGCISVHESNIPVLKHCRKQVK